MPTATADINTEERFYHDTFVVQFGRDEDGQIFCDIQQSYGTDLIDKESAQVIANQVNFILSLTDEQTAQVNKSREEAHERHWQEWNEKYGRSKEEKEKENKEGYIYVIKAGEHYKIGRAKNLNDRIKTHSTSNPLEVTLILDKLVFDYIAVEEDLLKRFEPKRVRGEWFSLLQEDLDFIKEYLESVDL